MSRLRRVRKVLLGVLALYLLLVAGLYLFQRSLIYHASSTEPPDAAVLARLGVEHHVQRVP